MQGLSLAKFGSSFQLIVRRADYANSRKAIDPDAIVSDGEDDALPLKFRIVNVVIDTSKNQLTTALQSLGWDGAKALRPAGPDAWVVAASNNPPSFMLLLKSASGNCKVLVRPLETRQASGRAGPEHTVSFPSYASAVRSGSVVPPAPPRPVTEKLEEIKTDMKEHVDKQIESIIEAQLESKLASLKEQVDRVASENSTQMTNVNSTLTEIKTQTAQSVTNANLALTEARQSTSNLNAFQAQVSAFIEAQAKAASSNETMLTKVQSMIDASQRKSEHSFQNTITEQITKLRKVSPAPAL